MSEATLFIFSGLPGSGKTTLAGRLAADWPAVHLRIDTIEQALRDLLKVAVEGEGYRLAYRVAADNLRLGLSAVATAEGGRFVNIEVVCSDSAEHRHRVEARTNTIPNLVLPTWGDVQAREYHAWQRPRITLDTAGRTPAASYRELRRLLEGA
jgi:predicted kinase